MKNTQKIKLPTDLVIAVTYDCNSRCGMCNIWKMEHKPELPVAEYAKLPSSVREINISGGEPFLRPDLPDLIRTIVTANPKVRINISSNGFAKHLIVERMKEILQIMPTIGIGISIDGMGAKQFEVRGIKGGFETNVQLIKELQALGMKNIRIGFTAGDYNIDDLYKVYQLANELGVEFTMAAVHNSENYFSTSTNHIEQLKRFKDEFKKIALAELRTFSIKRWLRAYFTYGLYRFVERQERLLPNYSGTEHLFIDPFGTVYTSNMSTRAMGNIRDHASFEALLESPTARDIVATADRDPQSWMICTVRSSMKNHPLSVISWVARAKLFGVHW